MEFFDKKTDEELVASYQSGDISCSAELIMRYNDVVRSCASNLFLKGGEKEDLYQEGRIGLFFAIEKYNSNRGIKFATFATVCIKNSMKSAIESSNQNKHLALNESVYLDSEALDEQSSLHMNPEHLALSRENAKELGQGMIDELSSLEKEVFTYMLAELDYKQIAQRLHRSPKSIDNAIQRIRNKLEKSVV